MGYNPRVIFQEVDIPGGETIQEINLFNRNGLKIRSVTGKNHLDMGDFTPGIYFLEVVTDSGSVYKKIVRN